MKVTQTDFRVYSSSEILQLSVKEINNPQTFDLLQNSVEGGLHDPALGPNRRDDRCETCCQSERNCPGHLGHIKLPVLLYNPLLFKVLLKILKGSCLSCHKINLPLRIKQVTIAQLTLLEHGFLPEALDLGEQFSQREKTDRGNEINAIVQGLIKGSKQSDCLMTKNKLTQIKNIIDCVLRSLNMATAVCCLCKTKNRKLGAEYNTTIIGTLCDVKRKPKSASARKAEEDEDAEEQIEMEENEEKPTESEEKLGEEVPAVDSDLQMEMDQFLQSKHKRCILYPNVAREHLKMLWEYEKKFLSKIFPFLAKVNGADVSTDVFFLDVIPVAPTKFRPLSVMNERKYEHPQTANLAGVLRGCLEMKELLRTYSRKVKGTIQDTVQGPTIPEKENLTAHMQKMSQCWVGLQAKVNVVLDSDLDKLSTEKCNGVKQLLEKKEGLFRMHMMGKRVNFAARSVISPDPYIATKEVGIPLVFASKLTYPQRVTPFNVSQLRTMVINGPNKYPGAYSVINEDGSVVKLSPNSETQRTALANQLLVPDNDATGCKTVCRHLINGDYLLLNRQPTLHRCSIQAHKARVLPNIKTLRMHYSNCKAYNADFDGDEMNAHFVQCEPSRAESNQLLGTDNQYLSPRDGSPLAGLIQDHMVSGAWLMIRGRFFSKKDYCGLLWGAMSDWQVRVKTVPPAIVKPRPLWSGKQIITTILLNIIPEGTAPLNLKSKAKIPEKSWTKSNKNRPLSNSPDELGESTVIISEGELLQGVLDKAHYGPSSYGLVHCLYELYGGDIAGKLLTYLGRLFTTFLQMMGFSLGVGDILVTDDANARRKEIIAESLLLGRDAAIKGLMLKDEDITDQTLLTELKKAHANKAGTQMAELDMSMKKETDKIQDGISKCIMPWGLEKSFPDNSLQLMVQSGAKGSPVNCMQISCLLGQIELEGRRPPLMMSGRSLPSFLPHDVSPRAGGFVTGRFLTGIRPQEYFFHCMAGREGLIDTAVKTSRSGYLQRCLVKHLEGIMVNYDMTVRDSDGSVLQFYYGEDGIEPQRNPFLKPNLLPFLTQNVQCLVKKNSPSPWMEDSKESSKKLKKTLKKISKCKKKMKSKMHARETGFLEFCGSEFAPSVSETDRLSVVEKGRFAGRTQAAKILCEAWEKYTEDERLSIWKKTECPDPVMSRLLPHSQPGILSENFQHNLNVFMKKGFDEEVSKLKEAVDSKTFERAVNEKVLKSMAHPGEGVGLVLAQSIGEPSTQMTLNTFHFAGRGEMNVTLGIPRLREILMTGSNSIKTPSMDVPVLPGKEDKAQWLQKHLNMVTLDKVLEYMKVKVMTRGSTVGNQKLIEAKLKFLPKRDYESFSNLKPRDLVCFVVDRFIPRVHVQIQKEMSLLEKSTMLGQGKVRRSATSADDADMSIEGTGGKDEEDETEPNDGDTTAVKERVRQTDTQEYEGEEEERREMIKEEPVSDDDEDGGDSGVERDTEENPDKEDRSSSEDEANSEKKSNKDKLLEIKATKIDFIESFKFSSKYKWVKIVFKYNQSNMQLDVRRLFQQAAKASVVHRVGGINQAFLSEVRQELTLKTDGINMQEMFKYPDIIDLNRLHCNCIHTMARYYGIEAAYKVIIREIQSVFGAYGIEVDYRHLSLLADFMTVRGEYDAFNRRDIHYASSPLQKMTFETTVSFLLDSTVSGGVDSLKSPSAQIVLGRPITVGTGAFDILHSMK